MHALSHRQPRRLITAAGSAVVAGLLLAGCVSAPTAGPAPTASATVVTVPADEVLARHGLAGLSVEQVIDRLDASEDDRASGPVGSVRAGELIVTDSQGQARLPMPGDRFYLSIAPYVASTHDCFNHNLATCKGELASKTMRVRVLDAAGAALVDRDVTTFANGFAGLWLPRGIKGTLTVSYDGKSATAAIGTGDDDPTCLTTLKLA